jgi:hypothetical protein
VIDAPAAPAAMVKTCRREIPRNPVMTSRPAVRGQINSVIVKRFARRRRNGFLVCDLISQRIVGSMLRATPARVCIELTT